MSCIESRGFVDDDLAGGGAGAASFDGGRSNGGNGAEVGVAGYHLPGGFAGIPAGVGGGGGVGGSASAESGAPNAGGTAGASAAPNAGGTGAESGTPSEGGTSSSSGGTNAAGAPLGGEGGAPGGAVTTVHGRVMDFLGHGVPGAAVTIGSLESLTDTNGEFTIEEAPPEYDVNVTFSLRMNSRTERYTWVYQGLTRRDPTIQVYRGVEVRDSRIKITTSNGVFDSERRTRVGIGTPDGWSLLSMFSAANETDAVWYGPEQTAGIAHGLRFRMDGSGFPAAYEAYDDGALLLTHGVFSAEAPVVPLDLTSKEISADVIAGTVTSDSGASRTLAMYVRFASNAVVTLVSTSTNAESFSFLAPTLPNAVITIAANHGVTNLDAGYALVHRDVAPGQDDVDLELPTPPMLFMPESGTSGVNETTSFRWTTEAAVSVLHVVDAGEYRDLYVVTSKKAMTLPRVNGQIPLRRGANHIWCVQDHGSWPSVDAAAGPNGFQDAFGIKQTFPEGPRRGDGTLSQSEKRSFVTAATE